MTGLLLILLTYLLYIFAFLLVFCVAVYVYITWTHSLFKAMGLPGPKPGFLGLLADYSTKGIIETDKELLKKYGRVIGAFHGQQPLMLVSDPEIIKQVCVKEFNNFINRKSPAWPGEILSHAVSAQTNEAWKASRSILSPSFSSGKMRNMVPLIQQCVDKLRAAVKKEGKDGKSLEIRSLAECFTMNIIASTGFGMDVDAHDNPNAGFVRHAKIAMTYTSSAIQAVCVLFPFMYHVFKLFNVSPMNQKSQDFFYRAVSEAIKERAAQNVKRPDLLQLMLNAHNESSTSEEEVMDPDAKLNYSVAVKRKFTEKEILANSLVFMLAGYDTTASLIMFACHSLAVNPTCQQRLLEEIETHLGQEKASYDNVWSLKYLDCVVNETLRMYPPSTRVSRTAEEEITIQGLTIPAGMSVHFPVYAMQHDPEFWHDPETFDPDRFALENRQWHPYTFLPFGAGPRNCIGMRQALLVAKLALVDLVRHFNIQSAPDTEVCPKLEKGGFVRPLNPLYVRFVSRQQ